MIAVAYLSGLGLCLYHIFGIPHFYGLSTRETKGSWKHQLRVVGTALLTFIGVAYFLEPTNSFNSNQYIFPLVFLLSSIGAITFDFWILHRMYHSELSEKVFVEKYAGHERMHEALKQKQKEIESERTSLLSQYSTVNQNESAILSLQEQLQDKETLLLEKQEHIENRNRQIQLKEDNFDRLLENRINEREKELQLTYEERLIEERTKISESYNLKMASNIDLLAKQAEKRISNEKQILVDDVFSFEEGGVDDIFELKKTRESLNKEKEAIEKSKFLSEVDEKVIKAQEHVLQAKSSALEVKSENVDIRSEIKGISNDFKLDMFQEKSQREKSEDTLLHKLEIQEIQRKSDYLQVENKLALMDEQTKSRFVELASIMTNSLKDLEMKTMTSFREVRESMSDIKLEFGQQILRLDGQQGKILNELESYHMKTKDYVNQCQALALDARQNNIEGHRLVDKVNDLYRQHKWESKGLEQSMQSSLETISLKEGQLANSVGESMLKLKSISDQQYTAMKDLALEKKDVNLLWKEKNQEHEMNLQEVRHQKDDLGKTKQFLDQERSNFNEMKSGARENMQLQHRNFMNEYRYQEALNKANSSGGFLSRLARVIENK